MHQHYKSHRSAVPLHNVTGSPPIERLAHRSALCMSCGTAHVVRQVTAATIPAAAGATARTIAAAGSPAEAPSTPASGQVNMKQACDRENCAANAAAKTRARDVDVPPAVVRALLTIYA
jgi:hypothetical protein